MSKIAFISSDDRTYNIERSLSLIKGEIISGLKNAKKVVIKPNCVSDDTALAATHADALRAVLEFIEPYTHCQVAVAEGTAEGNTLTAFKNFGYLSLQDTYDFSIVDLNNDDYELVELVDNNNKPWQAQISKTILQADYLISVSPPKTHNEVVYTGAIKNVTVGSLLRTNGGFTDKIASRLGLKKNNKTSIHQGFAATNENIARLFCRLPIHLAILDAFTAMEGNGPINGDMVPSHFALCSSDPLAADWLACQMMGIDINDVGYLSLLGAGKEEHFVIGDDWKSKIFKFKMHKDFEKMRHWKR